MTRARAKSMPFKAKKSDTKPNRSNAKDSASESASETEKLTETSDIDGSDSDAEEDTESRASDDGFEDQGSSSEDEKNSSEDSEDDLNEAEKKNRAFAIYREQEIEKMRKNGSLQIASHLHMDDLSSDDEQAHNTIGNVPLRWYENYDHIGYSVDGKKIIKSNQEDAIDSVIAAKDDPNYARTIYDAYNDQKIVVSDRDLEVIRRIQAGAYPHPEFQAHPEYVDLYSSDKMIHSLGNDQEPKSRFIPSKWERMKVAKIVKGIQEGRIRLDGSKKTIADVYQMWKEDDLIEPSRGPPQIKAPKMPLPGHAESYNPPEEYLFTDEERRAWEEMDPEDRETDFIPQKFDSLRKVCGYNRFVRERFERCLDLYLCPRMTKRKLNIDPESLVPQLPKPRDLRPFPNSLALVFNGHTERIRSLSMDPCGQYLASGSDDCTVRIWELETARCLQVYKVGSIIHKLEWNPNPDHAVLAVAAGKTVLILSTGTGNTEQKELTEALLGDADSTIDTIVDSSQLLHVDLDPALPANDASPTSIKMPVSWQFYKGNASKNQTGSGIRMILTHTSDVKHLTWHYKGDYLATVTPAAESSAILIHQISKRKTQNPFRKKIGSIQCVQFHPSKPFFFLATQCHVRIYNLIKQTLVKKLSSGSKWISSMDIHPSGDHVITGSYDRRLCWFDLDLSSMAFKTLKYHEKAIRAVAFHARYPLMASASDDGTVHIFHATVYSDLMKNPLIVPLKILGGHSISVGLGIFAVAFHPQLPWLVTGGADGTMRLFQNAH